MFYPTIICKKWVIYKCINLTEYGKVQKWVFNVSDSESEVAQSCLTLCDPIDCNLLSSSTLGIFQAKMLEWVAISFSRGYSQPRDRMQVSCFFVGRCFTIWVTREVSLGSVLLLKSHLQILFQNLKIFNFSRLIWIYEVVWI